MAVKDPRSKYWCFTLNNPTATEETYLRNIADERTISYLVFGIEVGESGTRHFQGYVEFVNRRRLSMVKRFLTRAHWELRRGTSLEAAEYCKKDGEVFEFGTLSTSKQGKRTDLEEIQKDMEQGMSANEVAKTHFSKWVVYRRSFEAYEGILNAPKFRPELQVVLLQGVSGAGKSSYVYSRFPDAWISTNPVMRWFDGYRGQETVLIDDFAGECPFRFFLRLLDIYPIRVEIKGGTVAWNPTRIFITSNKSIEEWYHGEKDMQPVRRRIHHVIVMHELENDDIGERHDEIDQILDK